MSSLMGKMIDAGPQRSALHPPTVWRRHRGRLVAAAAVCLLLLLMLKGPEATHKKEKENSGGWAGSYLYDQADAKLTKLLNEVSWVSPLRHCAADSFSVEGLPAIAAERLMLGNAAGGGAIADQPPVVATAHNLPCKTKAGGGSCCERSITLRMNTTDFKVFKQVFQCHYMRYLYPLFGDQEPKYILDAGANVGFATVLFKLLWPQATIVSLEPDGANYAMLQKNTEGLADVHAVNAGLWSHKANITLVSSRHGAWGRVFREAQEGEEGTPAYAVQDLADMLDIPAFDFVKVDIEGAEGMVFAPGGDFSWIKRARAVSMEIHDFFARYFGLKEVSSRVDAAFNTTGYSIASDNEHLLFLSPELAASLAAVEAPSQQEIQASTDDVRSVCW